MATRYNKYVTYAALELPESDISDSVKVLEEVLSDKIKVIFPLTVLYAGRNIKINTRSELQVMYTSLTCTTDIVTDSKKSSNSNQHEEKKNSSFDMRKFSVASFV